MYCIFSIYQRRKTEQQTRYHDYPETKIKRLHISQRIQQKICSNSTISNNFHMERFLYFKIIYCCQREYPFMSEKLTCAEYQKGCFYWVRNTIELVTYKDKIFISQKLQKYAVKWYHTYLLHPGLDRMEVTSRQH